MNIDAIKNYYDHLTPSDQRVLKILGIFLLLVVCYWLVAASFEYRDKSVDSWVEGRKLTRLLAVNKKVFKLSAKNKPTGAVGKKSLLVTASSIAKQQQINFKRAEPKGKDALKLWIESVSFNKVLVFLHKLDVEHGVFVDEIAVDKKDTDGYADVRITLQRH